MSCGIYKITNLINNKCYIGQSIHIEKRWIEHRQCGNPDNQSFNRTKHLYSAIAKYGIDNFSFNILEECEATELDSLEVKYIEQYNSTNTDFGYNKQLGGANRHLVTPSYVLEVISELKESTETINEMAARLHLNRRTIIRINIGESWPQVNEVYPIRNFRVTSVRALEKAKAKNALKEFLKKQAEAQRYNVTGKLSEEELQERRRATCCKPKYDWPAKDVLAVALYKTSFEAVGKQYGVTSNTIRKLCKKYDIPTHKKEFIDWYNKNYSTD